MIDMNKYSNHPYIMSLATKYNRYVGDVALWHYEGGRCHYCRRDTNLGGVAINSPLFATRDHKKPKCQGGTNAMDNVVSACYECNSKKGNTPYDKFKQRELV